MGIRIGPIDMMQVSFEIINKLIEKNLISIKDAREIIKSSLDPNMSDADKEKFIDSLLVKKNGK